MASNEQLSPVPIRARLKAIEIVDIDNLKNKKSYFVTISVDDSVAITSGKIEKYKGDCTLHWEWPEESKFGVHPSSTIAIKVYRPRKLPLMNDHLVGEHSVRFTELVHQDDATFELKNEKGFIIPSKIKISLALVPAPTEELENFMKSVDANIALLDSTTQMSTGISIIGTALQFTKSIMDIVADAHPILKASWTLLSAVYDAVQAVELQDDSVRELASGLRELLAVANQHPDLLVVKGTDNIIDEIGRMSLEVTSLIYEYAKQNLAQRAANLKLSDLRKRIGDCQKSCNDLKEKFDRRVNMEINVMVKGIKDDKLAGDIWKWLSAPDSSSNFNTAVKKCQAGTCDWVCDEKWFSDFQENPGFFWIKATAGCGKTILCAFIIQKVIELLHRTGKQSAACGYFFFDGRDAQKSLQFHDGLIRSLIRQLSDRCGGIPPALVDLYHRYNGHQQPPTAALQDTLRLIIDVLPSVHIVVDSLDECVEGEELLDWIRQVIRSKKQNLHVILASRPRPDIEKVLQDPSLDCRLVDLVRRSNEGIQLYLEEHVSFLLTEKTWSEETQQAVKSTLLKGAEGMFQWVALQLSALRKCPNEESVVTQLKKLPKGLNETYDRILAGIDEDYRDHVQTFLRWLCFSKREMTLQEIADTVTVDFDTKDGPKYVASRRYKNERDVLEKCSVLVTQSEDRVKLAHFSVKEYLLSEYLHTSPPALSSFYLSSAELSHAIISQTCLAYLLHFDAPDSLKKFEYKSPELHIGNSLPLDPSKENFEESFPLARYAARYWILHANINLPETSLTWTLVYMLFNPDSAAWINWVQIWDPESPGIDLDLQRRITDTPLHYATLAALPPVIEHLLRNGADINALGGQYGTALQAAAWQQHTEIVKLLLGNGANVNLVGGQNGSALQVAAYRGSTEIVTLLLQNGAEVNLVGGKYGTALQAAASEGNIEIVQLLLENGAEVNLVGGVYSSALQAAACMGWTEIITMLLENGAEVNLVGGVYGSALRAAAERGHTEVVTLLLENGAEVNLVGGVYGSALRAAAERGHTEVVKLLLENGAEVNLVGGVYGSALRAAAERGHTEVVTLLLENGAEVNLVGGVYISALQAAARRGCTEVVKLLLENGAEVNLVGGVYDSALQAAAYKGNTGIITLLLENGAEVNLVGGEYGSALQAAARRGRTEVVKLLLENGAEVNLVGGEYGSALQAASAAPPLVHRLNDGSSSSSRMDRYHKTVEMLLSNGADVSLWGGKHGSALQAAIDEGNDEIAQLLRDAQERAIGAPSDDASHTLTNLSTAG